MALMDNPNNTNINMLNLPKSMLNVFQHYLDSHPDAAPSETNSGLRNALNFEFDSGKRMWYPKKSQGTNYDIEIGNMVNVFALEYLKKKYPSMFHDSDGQPLYSVIRNEPQVPPIFSKVVGNTAVTTTGRADLLLGHYERGGKVKVDKMFDFKSTVYTGADYKGIIPFVNKKIEHYRQNDWSKLYKGAAQGHGATDIGLFVWKKFNGKTEEENKRFIRDRLAGIIARGAASGAVGSDVLYNLGYSTESIQNRDTGMGLDLSSIDPTNFTLSDNDFKEIETLLAHPVELFETEAFDMNKYNEFVEKIVPFIEKDKFVSGYLQDKSTRGVVSGYDTLRENEFIKDMDGLGTHLDNSIPLKMLDTNAKYDWERIYAPGLGTDVFGAYSDLVKESDIRREYKHGTIEADYAYKYAKALELANKTTYSDGTKRPAGGGGGVSTKKPSSIAKTPRGGLDITNPFQDANDGFNSLTVRNIEQALLASTYTDMVKSGLGDLDEAQAIYNALQYHRGSEKGFLGSNSALAKVFGRSDGSDLQIGRDVITPLQELYGIGVQKGGVGAFGGGALGKLLEGVTDVKDKKDLVSQYYNSQQATHELKNIGDKELVEAKEHLDLLRTKNKNEAETLKHDHIMEALDKRKENLTLEHLQMMERAQFRWEYSDHIRETENAEWDRRHTIKQADRFYQQNSQFYDWTRWNSARQQGLGEIQAAANWVPGSNIFNRFSTAVYQMADASTSKKKGIWDAVGAAAGAAGMFGLFSGNPFLAIGGGLVNAASNIIGSLGEGDIKSKYTTIASKFNMWGTLFEAVKGIGGLVTKAIQVPLKLLEAALKAGAVAIGAVLGTLVSGFNQMNKLGNPLSTLTGGSSYYQYQKSLSADRLSGMQQGSYSGLAQSMSMASHNLMLGQYDEQQLIAAVQAGGLDYMYFNRGQNTYETTGAFIEKQASEILGMDTASAGARMNQLYTMSPALAQNVQTYMNYLKNPNAAARAGVKTGMGFNEFSDMNSWFKSDKWKISDEDREVYRYQSARVGHMGDRFDIVKMRVASALFDKFGDKVLAWAEKLAVAIESFSTGDMDFSGIWNTLREGLSKVAGFIKEVFGPPIRNAFIDMSVGVLEGIKNMIPHLYTLTSTLLSEGIGLIVQLGKALNETIGNVVMNLMDTEIDFKKMFAAFATGDWDGVFTSRSDKYIKTLDKHGGLAENANSRGSDLVNLYRSGYDKISIMHNAQYAAELLHKMTGDEFALYDITKKIGDGTAKRSDYDMFQLATEFEYLAGLSNDGGTFATTINMLSKLKGYDYSNQVYKLYAGSNVNDALDFIATTLQNAVTSEEAQILGVEIPQRAITGLQNKLIEFKITVDSNGNEILSTVKQAGTSLVDVVLDTTRHIGTLSAEFINVLGEGIKRSTEINASAAIH